MTKFSTCVWLAFIWGALLALSWNDHVEHERDQDKTYQLAESSSDTRPITYVEEPLVFTKPQARVKPTVSRNTAAKSPTQHKLALAITKVYRAVEYETAQRIVELTHQHARKHNLNPMLMIGLIAAESSFNRNAVSPVGAIGYTQVLPKWHQEKIRGRDLRDVRVSIEVGAQVLKDCFDRRGNTKMALACYNGAQRKKDIEEYYTMVMDRKDRITTVMQNI